MSSAQAVTVYATLLYNQLNLVSPTYIRVNVESLHFGWYALAVCRYYYQEVWRYFLVRNGAGSKWPPVSKV